jgi:hypothetical protein
MVKKLLIAFTLLAFTSSLFAGFSGGGRSGFSGGSRSFSSSRSYSTAGRSGYSRSTNTTRAYVAPRTYTNSRPVFTRSYSGSSSNTIIHNNHYSHGGFGGGFGGGFFSGMLGGYIGSTLFSGHHPVAVAAAGTEVMPQGQGMLMDNGGYVTQSSNIFSNILGGILVMFLLLVLVSVSVMVFRALFGDRRYSNRW